MDFNLQSSSVHEIPQQEYWSALPFPSPGALPDPGIQSMSSILAAGIQSMSSTLAAVFFTTEPVKLGGKKVVVYAENNQFSIL